MRISDWSSDVCSSDLTVCGGAGAGPDFDGASAVHTHMTNSRLTDPEVLEWRFPVLLESFAIMRGSGGRGERKRVVQGKSVSVRVHLGGSRNIKQKKISQYPYSSYTQPIFYTIY